MPLRKFQHRHRSKSQRRRRNKSHHRRRSKSQRRGQKKQSRRAQLKQALKKLTLTLAGGDTWENVHRAWKKDESTRKSRKSQAKQRLLDKKFKTDQYYTASTCKKGYKFGKRTKSAQKHGLHVCKPNSQRKHKRRRSRVRKPSKQALKRYTKGACENKEGYRHRCSKQSKFAKKNKMTVCCKRRPRKRTQAQRDSQKVRKHKKKSTKNSTKKSTKKKVKRRKSTRKQKTKSPVKMTDLF